MSGRDDKRTLEIFIHNLTQAQAIAIEDMLAIWQQGGSLGCSRWTAFFADGDGNFRPTCVVNGHVARHQRHVAPEKFWTNGELWRGDYKIDFDAIAWALRKEEADRAASQLANESSLTSDAVGQERVTPIVQRVQE